MKKIKIFIFLLIISGSFGLFSPNANALYRWSGLGIKDWDVLQPAPGLVSPASSCYVGLQGGCNSQDGNPIQGFRASTDKTKCEDVGVCCKINIRAKQGSSINDTYAYQLEKFCTNWGTGDDQEWGIESKETDRSKCIRSNFDCCCPAPQATPPNNKEKPNIITPLLEVKIPTVALSEVNCVLNDKGDYVCAIPWIGEYINGLYKYGMNIVGILAALVLMGGGLLWLISGGDSSKITQAKGMIIGAITGLVILACSYIILTQVNPDLVKMRSISMGYITKDIVPNPTDSALFAQNCKSTTVGNCAVANMAGFGEKAEQASAICMAESGGNASIYNYSTKCSDSTGQTTGYAVWGLFQFNLSANNFIDASGKILNCPKAFGNSAWVNSKPKCTITDRTLYDACVKAASDPKLSIKNAVTLLGKAGNWGPWEANSKSCHFPK